MATTQEALDLKYDIIQAEKSEKLRKLFSEEVLGWARDLNLNTFEEMVNYDWNIQKSYRFYESLKGLNLLKNMTVLVLDTSIVLADVGNLSSLKNLNFIRLEENNLTNIGNLSNLTNLTYLRVNSNPLTGIGTVQYMTLLTYLNLSSTSISNFGYLGNLTALSRAYFSSMNLSTSKVDEVLSQLKTAHEATGVLTVLTLTGNSIPTGGVNNAAYVYLVGQGVTVSIDV